MSRSITNPDTFRENIRDKFSEIVHDVTIATNLEKAVYNYAVSESTKRKIIKKWENPVFSQVYIDHLRTIYSNLKNPALLSQLTSKELAPHTFVFMTHQEMNPERWKVLLDKKSVIDANKFTTNVQASTDMFTCPVPKCRSKRCTYYTLQVRSADEPESVFVSCLDCGKNFRKG